MVGEMRVGELRVGEMSPIRSRSDSSLGAGGGGGRGDNCHLREDQISHMQA